MSEPRFKELRVWQEGMNLVKEIYSTQFKKAILW